MTATI